MWCIPNLTPEFIESMEGVLRVYEKPYDPKEPVVCLDEKPVQCLADITRTVRVRNGSIRRDYEYVRHGTANVFCIVEPKAGRHLTNATKNRKHDAFARALRRIAAAYQDARTIHLVMDNLSTHSLSSLHNAFGAAEGNKLWSRFTVHHTPKHGSWLNQAEIAISIYSKQCLGKRRISSLTELKRETNAWRRGANKTKLRINWKFTVRKAREKFGYRVTKAKNKLSRN